MRSPVVFRAANDVITYTVPVEYNYITYARSSDHIDTLVKTLNIPFAKITLTSERVTGDQYRETEVGKRGILGWHNANSSVGHTVVYERKDDHTILLYDPNGPTQYVSSRVTVTLTGKDKENTTVTLQRLAQELNPLEVEQNDARIDVGHDPVGIIQRLEELRKSGHLTDMQVCLPQTSRTTDAIRAINYYFENYNVELAPDLPILNFPLQDELNFLYPKWRTNGICAAICVWLSTDKSATEFLKSIENENTGTYRIILALHIIHHLHKKDQKLEPSVTPSAIHSPSTPKTPETSQQTEISAPTPATPRRGTTAEIKWDRVRRTISKDGTVVEYLSSSGATPRLTTSHMCNRMIKFLF